MYAFQIGKNILPLSRKDLYKLKVSFVLLNSHIFQMKKALFMLLREPLYLNYWSRITISVIFPFSSPVNWTVMWIPD